MPPHILAAAGRTRTPSGWWNNTTIVDESSPSPVTTHRLRSAAVDRAPLLAAIQEAIGRLGQLHNECREKAQPDEREWNTYLSLSESAIQDILSHDDVPESCSHLHRNIPDALNMVRHALQPSPSVAVGPDPASGGAWAKSLQNLLIELRACLQEDPA